MADLYKIMGAAIEGGVPQITSGNLVPVFRNEGISGVKGGAIVRSDRAVTDVTTTAVMAPPSSLFGAGHHAVLQQPESVHAALGYAIIVPYLPPVEELDEKYGLFDQRLPTSISYGSSGGPAFNSTVFTVDSGEASITNNWAAARAKYEVEFDALPQDEMEAVMSFFYACRGSGYAFRFKDWSDYTIINHNIGFGNGVDNVFQLYKKYRSGGQVYSRKITQPVQGTVKGMKIDGVELVDYRDFYINPRTGTVTLTKPLEQNAVLSVDYIEFDVPVRFDTDELDVTPVDFNQYNIGSIDLIEVYQ